jgi:hypothetical protein
MDHDSRTDIAAREAASFRHEIGSITAIAGIFYFVIFGAAAYFGLPLKWLVVTAIGLAVGSIFGALQDIAYRLDIRCAWVELTTKDIYDRVSELHNRLDEL